VPFSARKLREIEARRIPRCPPNRSVAGEEPAPIDAHVAPQHGIGDCQLPERAKEVSRLHVESRIDIRELSTAAEDHGLSMTPRSPVSIADGGFKGSVQRVVVSGLTGAARMLLPGCGSGAFCGVGR